MLRSLALLPLLALSAIVQAGIMSHEDNLSRHGIFGDDYAVGYVVDEKLCARVEKGRYTMMVYFEKAVYWASYFIFPSFAILDHDCKILGIYRQGKDKATVIDREPWLPWTADFKKLIFDGTMMKTHYSFTYSNGLYSTDNNGCGCKGFMGATKPGTNEKYIYSMCNCDFAKDRETKPKSIPPPSKPELKCNGLDNKKWLARDKLAESIDQFCGDLDGGSGTSFKKEYNADSGDSVEISINWESTDKPNQDACTSNLRQVMDSCDADEEKNALNWKHGGTMEASGAKYAVTPTAERYLAGKCSMHVKQKDNFSGIDGPGTARKHDYSVNIDAKDGTGKSFADSDGYRGAKDGAPYKFNAYYATMEVTPEASDDYVQFTMGKQSWTSGKKEGRTRCNKGGWNRGLSPAVREMDCFFDC